MASSGVNLESYLIPLEEIIRATGNFSQRIGDGGFGAVYKGQLSDRWQNRMVAVKRRHHKSRQGNHEFRNEVEMISKFHHENVISFMGYCDEGIEMIIVYEYATNKSLDYYLADPTKMRRITWIQRLKICMGAARGLDYLHSGLGEHNRVIHRDVKSANILLDGNFVAKICDFGLSRVGPRNQPCTELDTKVAGTHYYMDPTYQESGILRKESDVYSFGVVLFEILSGTLVYCVKDIRGHPQILMNLVRHHQMKPDKLIDDNIRDQVDSRSLDTFKEIAYQCISLDISRRPTLDTVIKKIGEALFFQKTCINLSPIPATHSKIEERLLRKLNSGLLYDLQTTTSEMCLLTKIKVDNRIGFAKAGAIPLLIDLLKTSTPWIQEHAVTTLLNLSLLHEENKGSIVSSGAVPCIIYVLETGTMEARVNAAATLSSLCEIYKNKAYIGDEGAIPPLVSLLIKTTHRGRKVAVTTLFNLCLDPGNKERVVRAGIIPILMVLLKEPQGVLKDKALTFLSILSTHHEGVLAIGKVRVVPVMVEFVGSGSPKNKEDAASVLVELCNNSGDIKYLVEAHQHGVWGKVTDLLQYGTNRGKEKAGQLLEKLEEHHLDNYPANAQIRDDLEPSSIIVLITCLFIFLIVSLIVVTICRDLYYNFSIRSFVSGRYRVFSQIYGALSWDLLIRLIGRLIGAFLFRS